MTNTLSEFYIFYFANLILSYFSIEIFLAIGILFNFIFSFFSSKNTKIKPYSNFITTCVLALSSIFGFGIYFINTRLFYNHNLDINLFNNFIVVNNYAILLKSILSLFFVFFFITQRRTFQKFKIKPSILNLSICSIALFSSFLVQSNNFILSYIFLEVVLFLIYKFSSYQNIGKNEPYSLEFIFISISASFLFVLFFIASNFIKIPAQLSIISTCLAMALLLKVGIFPMFSYSLDRQHKNNISFCTLLFGLLLFLGLLCFNQLSNIVDFQDKIFQSSILIFLSVCVLSCGIYALKKKNIISFCAHSLTLYFALCYINSVIYPFNFSNISLAILYLFLAIALYSILCALNIKLTTINAIKGIYYSNKQFSYLFITLMLILGSILPTKIFFQNLKTLFDIYSYNNVCYLVVVAIVLSIFLVLINSLNIIKSCFEFNFKIFEFNIIKKGTSVNFLIPFLIILYLIVKIL